MAQLNCRTRNLSMLYLWVKLYRAKPVSPLLQNDVGKRPQNQLYKQQIVHGMSCSIVGQQSESWPTSCSEPLPTQSAHSSNMWARFKLPILPMPHWNKASSSGWTWVWWNWWQIEPHSCGEVRPMEWHISQNRVKHRDEISIKQFHICSQGWSLLCHLCILLLLLTTWLTVVKGTRLLDSIWSWLQTLQQATHIRDYSLIV